MIASSVEPTMADSNRSRCSRFFFGDVATDPAVARNAPAWLNTGSPLIVRWYSSRRIAHAVLELLERFAPGQRARMLLALLVEPDDGELEASTAITVAADQVSVLGPFNEL